MATWPALPAPLLTGNGGTNKPNLRRTEMESGPARVARVAAAHLTDLNVSWLFSPAQMTTFMTFFEDDLFSGADWFDIALDSGGGARLHRCRFREGYRFARQGLNYSLTAVLETEAVW
tara:strand:- start:11684 stop:12037 length:354 start_codon:yes stop_codon:yes gene_type:complete